MKRRIFFNSTDLSTTLNDFYNNESTLSLTTSDYIYLSSDLPFNHFWVEMGVTKNIISSIMDINVWDGNNWASVAEVIDETEGFKQSNFITFTPNKNNTWKKEDTENISELSSVNIYDKYWLRISFSADLTPSINLKWIGQLFSNDDDLKSEFPDFGLTSMMTAFETGKTDWKDQHYVAAKLIIKDLISMKVIRDENQVLTREDLTLPSVQKVASIIFNTLGDDYRDQLLTANKEYKERLKNAYVIVDLDNNAIITSKERRPFVGVINR